MNIDSLLNYREEESEKPQERLCDKPATMCQPSKQSAAQVNPESAVDPKPKFHIPQVAGLQVLEIEYRHFIPFCELADKGEINIHAFDVIKSGGYRMQFTVNIKQT